MDGTTITTAAISADTAHIATALSRLHHATQRPGFGHSTKASVSVLGERLRCSSSEGSSTIDSDLVAALGGDATAPTPTTLLRAALGACLAMSYRLQASRLGIELTSVRVTVESESELVGMLDPDADAPAGYTALRYHVEIESPAAAADIERIVDLADRLSPVLDTLVRPNAVDRTVSITAPPESEQAG